MRVVQQIYAKFLTRQNLTLTKKKSSILKESISVKRHFSAGDLIKILKRKNLEISRATVYRTLNEFVRAELFVCTVFGEKHHHFEFAFKKNLITMPFVSNVSKI